MARPQVRLTPRRLALGALTCLALGSPWWGPRVLRELPAFGVRRVEVSGARLLAPHQVLAASGIRAGESLWGDAEAWEAALKRHPAVADAHVSRVLPGTLRIRVEEKQPVALVELGTLRPATAEGEVLPVDPARARVDLPLVRGAGKGAALDSTTLALLAEAGRLRQMDPELMARVSEVRAGAGGGILLVLSRPYAVVALPRSAEEARLLELRAVLADLERRAASARPGVPVQVDVRFEAQVVVRSV